MGNEEKILRLLENLQNQLLSLTQGTNSKFAAMENRFDSMEQRFDSMGKRLDSMEQRFDSMGKRLDSMEQRFESVEKRLDSMEQNTNEKFAAIDKRFDSIEETIVKEIESTRAELKVEIQYVHDELKDLRTDLANVEQVTAKNWLDISRLKAIR